MKTEELEHDLICNTGTHIKRLYNELENLDEMIEEYRTYTNNTFFLAKLKNLKQRMLNDLTGLENNFESFVEYHTP